MDDDNDYFAGSGGVAESSSSRHYVGDYEEDSERQRKEKKKKRKERKKKDRKDGGPGKRRGAVLHDLDDMGLPPPHGDAEKEEEEGGGPVIVVVNSGGQAPQEEADQSTTFEKRGKSVERNGTKASELSSHGRGRPFRRRRHDSDDGSSEERKKTRQGRRKRYDSDDEDDRRTPRSPSKDNHRRRRHGSSAHEEGIKMSSQGRKRRHDSDNDGSPSERTRRHRRRYDSDDDDCSNGSDGKSGCRDEKFMSTGHSAGLQSAQKFKEAESKLREKRHMEAVEAGARGGDRSDTIYRDASGRQIDMHEELLKRDADRANQLKLDEIESEALHKGRAQKERELAAEKNMEAIAAGSFARSIDDADLEAARKDAIRDGDPMAARAAKKTAKSWGPIATPVYKGPPPKPNRFGILPGYRWDGVDRGNGFEDKVLAKKYSRQIRKEEAYKYSVSDM